MPRSTCEIISDILETAKKEENCKKTKIIRFANLDWNMAEKYLSYLIEREYLETYDDGTRGKESYRVTQDGEELLWSVEKVKDICEELE